jgi:hypothetical protein
MLKLAFYGLKGNASKWFTSYLTHKRHSSGNVKVESSLCLTKYHTTFFK